jgi:hypothetical protein
MRHITAILTSALALGLAACSQDSPSMSQRMDSVGDSISNATANSSTTQGMSSTISTTDFQQRAAMHPIPVMVHGGALGLDRPALERKVANDMQGSTWGPKARFMPSYQQVMPSQGHEFSIVMMVNGPQQVTGADLCAASVPKNMKPATASPKATPMKKGDVRVLSALCHYDHTVNQVEARATSITGASDPAFDKLIVTAANQLTQPQPGQIERPASPGQEQ